MEIELVGSTLFFIPSIQLAGLPQAEPFRSKINRYQPLLLLPTPLFDPKQVTGLAETFSAAHEKLNVVDNGGEGGGNTNETSPEEKANAHTLEGHRQTMAGVVPRLYQLLSNTVEAEDTSARSQEGGDTTGAGAGVMTEGIRGVLHGKPWLWVGDAFVPADQVGQIKDRSIVGFLDMDTRTS